MSIDDFCWPLSDLGQAVACLLSERAESLESPASPEQLTEWLHWAALRCEAEVIASDVALSDLESLLLQSSPAIYELESGYLIVRRAGTKLRVVAPDLSERTVTADRIASAIRAPFRAQQAATYQSLLNDSGLSRSRQERIISALINGQSGARRFRRCWTFRPACETSEIKRGIPQLIAFHTVQYLLWLASWGVLGTLSFTGHMDRGWLTAWALLLLTLLPFRLLTTWTQGTFAISLGAMLKRRLLRGALRLEPDEVRTQGLGSFLGQVLEAEAIETLAISGGVTGLLALIELIPALFVLGRFSIALALWCCVAAFAAWRFFKNYERWTGQRMELTNHLVETMVGHRTRLAQQPRAGWHTDEDANLARYLSTSAGVDAAGAWLLAAVPRGWLLLGLACLAPSLVAGHPATSETAVLLGGVLLGYSAFRRMMASLADIAGAVTAWHRVKPLFDAASRKEEPGQIPRRLGVTRKGQCLLEAERLTYRYQGQATPALQGCNLSVRHGEKILLEGASGGGKTTLASLLCGLRQPDSGLLLVHGLDRYSLGELAWRKQIAVAPQFHENHIVTETLAFNLLMGRAWPPANADVRDAEQMCHELGLGELLSRMPSGLMQMVGEGGWQLSHGERSRLFLARALLQQSDMVILDESFAALDPENLQTAMETALRRAETLMVIAHP